MIPKKMNSLPFQVDQNMNDIKDLKAQTNQNIEDITNLKQTVGDVSALANNLNTDVTNLKQTVGDVSVLVNNLNTDVTNLKQTVEDVSVLANNLNTDVANLYVEISKITPLKFTNITVSTWVSDTTYTNYSYKANITLTGVTSSMVAEVIFNVTESESGNYAPVCETFDGGVYIYSKVNTAITIPTVLVVK